MSTKVYELVTQRIINELEKGYIPWQKPWTGIAGGAVSHVTGKAYSMLNQWMLDLPGEYLSFNQIKTEKGTLMKGSKAKIIVFFKLYKVTDVDTAGVKRDRFIPLLRYYNVFHISQCEGIKAKYLPVLPSKCFNPIEEAERIAAEFSQRENVPIHHVQQDRAFYSPRTDSITLPAKSQFEDSAEYYSTLFHEITHASGHEKRLNRFSFDSVWRESKEDYSKEELIAEIGAATILATLNIETQSSFKNSTAYIQNWVKALKDDSRMIISAASKAEKAIAYILNSDVDAATDNNTEELESI